MVWDKKHRRDTDFEGADAPFGAIHASVCRRRSPVHSSRGQCVCRGMERRRLDRPGIARVNTRLPPRRYAAFRDIRAAIFSTALLPEEEVHYLQKVHRQGGAQARHFLLKRNDTPGEEKEYPR